MNLGEFDSEDESEESTCACAGIIRSEFIQLWETTYSDLQQDFLSFVTIIASSLIIPIFFLLIGIFSVFIFTLNEKHKWQTRQSLAHQRGIRRMTI